MTDKQPKMDQMELRDYFAAKALPICYQYWMHDFYLANTNWAEGKNSNGIHDLDSGTEELIAETSYEIADAMLKARNGQT